MADAFLVERAGGAVTDLMGDPWGHDSHGLVASSVTRHGDMRAVARAVEDGREN